MGWIANEPGDSERSKVDSMINELIDYLDIKSGICQEYAGQARKCCRDIYSCFDSLKTALLNIKLTHQENPDVETACSQVQDKLNTVSACIEDQTSRCHVSLRQSNIRAPFYDAVNQLATRLNKLCRKTTASPSTTTSTTTTQVPSTVLLSTSKFPSSTTRTLSSSVTTLSGPSNTTTTQNANIVNADNKFVGRNNTTSLPENTPTTIIITSSAIGALTIVVVILVALFCLRKKNLSSYGSDGSAGSKRGFIWRWLHTSKPEEAQGADSEIYTEIDEAFMDAVYRVPGEPALHHRDKVHHTAQVNVCYGIGLNDDDIILSKPEPINVPAELLEYDDPGPLNPLDLIRKQNDITTSFNNPPAPSPRELNKPRSPGYQNVSKRIGSNAVLVLSNQKRFITSRPGFTDIPSSKGGEYFQIEASEGGDRIYAEPSEVDNVYDRASKFDLHRKPLSTTDNVYNSLHMYDSPAGSSRNPSKGQTGAETKVNQTKPNYLYEYPCLEY